MKQAVSTPEAITGPPRFLRLSAHPVRWRLLRELVHSDRAVRELTELVGEPQSLVSYHLQRLRAGGLVSARRSSADGRDCYYRVELAACADLLSAASSALHPGLWPEPTSRSPRPTPTEIRSSRHRPRVLFLCTGNSARSQMAEALLEHASNGTIDVHSAGSHPKVLHPNAVRVMRKRGIDISGRRAKHLDEFVGRRFNFVVTLCDKVREVCPEFPTHPDLVHWSMPDPALGGATDRASYPVFERTATDLEERIGFLLAVIHPSPTTRRPAHG